MSLIPVINRANQIRNTTPVMLEMHLSYNSTTSLNLRIQTASGDDWEIDWGDGVWERYTSSASYRIKTFGTSTAGVVKVRSATGRGLSDLHRVQSFVGTWNFDVADLYATYSAHFVGDSMAITGDVGNIKATDTAEFRGDLMTLTGYVGNIKATYQANFEGDLMTLTGDVGNIKATNTAGFIGDSMTLTGDVGDIKATYEAWFEGNSMTLTYTTKTWTHIPINYFSLSLAAGHLTTEEVSQMLIDMDASGLTGAYFLDFQYNNGGPNAAGAVAADNLRAKGFTVLTNVAVPTYDPDFQAWIDYNISQGHYMTNDTIKLDAANQYVIDSKADGTWYKKDFEFIFSWNDLNMANASLVCMKRLVKAVVYGGCTYTLNGWEGNGVDGYIESNYTPSIDNVNLQLGNGGRGFLITKFPTNTKWMLGTSGWDELYNIGSGGQKHFMSGGSGGGSAYLNDVTGLVSQYRDDLDTSRYIDTNGLVEVRDHITTSLSTRSIRFLGAANMYSNGGCGLVYYGSSISNSKHEVMRININTYLTEIGLTPIA